ncbi:endonuclease/exonuclease/phosphatase family protein [Gorillibacterium timonense]|uniref:endonuclease/exonuclease/phosphatase family protein n=1 Tax=Gorillibacterium timonense TaxID=1689269 RepID=UPI00071C7FDE|nr:endonuclease/exonuclease/phosphatase family protein [Gorillibacterium timonense]
MSLSPVMRLLSFNILVDRRTDAPYSWECRKRQIVDLIKAHNPDLICIQEALEHQKLFLAEELPDYEGFGVGRNDGRADGEQVPIFHRKGMFRELDRGHFWLSETPHLAGSIGWDAKCPRTAVWKLLQHESMERPFVLANTHYDHVGITANRNSVSTLQQELSAKVPPCATLFCGDFNSSEQTPAYQEILSSGFLDSSRAEQVVCTGMPFSYHRFNMELYGTDAHRLMQENNRMFRTIDHLFYRGDVQVLRHGILGDNREGVYPSDHFPLLCDFRFTG